MGILVGIVLGIVIGSAARWVMPGPSAGGLATAIPLGVGGAVLGGVVGVWVTGTVTGFHFLHALLATIGSLIVLFCYRSYAMRAAY
jgi:uncharacterized membrane protein YeaQ/YmgE (transglycosylase-associated protein family)